MFVLWTGILLLFPSITRSQFLDLRLDVDSELTASTEQPLNFGTLTTNSGQRHIKLGSMNMGIFSITALEHQLLLVTLDKPDVLRHDNPAIDATVPLTLYTRYNFSSKDYQTAKPLPEATSYLKVKSNPDPGPWNTIYIFMYGSVDIGDIPDGVYSNEIVLNVEYI